MRTHVDIILEEDPLVKRVFHHFYYQKIGVPNLIIGRKEYVARASRDLSIPEETVEKIVNFLTDSNLVEGYLGKSKKAFKHLV